MIFNNKYNVIPNMIVKLLRNDIYFAFNYY